MWHTKKQKNINGAIIQEPTIFQFMELKTAIDTDNVDTIQNIVSLLTIGEIPMIEAVNAIIEMALENPIKVVSNEDYEGPEIAWDIAILQEVDVVANRYKLNPYSIVREYTYRQLRYFVWTTINESIRETEKAALLHGAELKSKPKFMRLKEPDGLGTAGMTKQEIAKYWRAKKHEKDRLGKGLI